MGIFWIVLVSCPFLEKDKIWESGEGGGEGMRAPLRASVRSPSPYGILHLYPLAAAAPPPIAGRRRGREDERKSKKKMVPSSFLFT